MEKLYDIYERYRDYILFLILFIFVIGISLFEFWYFYNEFSMLSEKINERSSVVSEVASEKNEIVVDIKGEVKKPGVYIFDEGKRVIDVVKKAGGFTKKADSSVNNLSKKLSDEMVIIIYSKDEVADFLAVKEEEDKSYDICKNEIIVNNSCIDKNDIINSNSLKGEEVKKEEEKTSDEKDNSSSGSDEKKLISINTASKEELMTLPSIGEAKALAIIEYRNSQKFNTIEDIKNVSGIGDALFEKIKDFITT